MAIGRILDILLGMRFFVKSVASGFAMAMGSALFKKVSKKMGLDDEKTAEAEADAEKKAAKEAKKKAEAAEKAKEVGRDDKEAGDLERKSEQKAPESDDSGDKL